MTSRCHSRRWCQAEQHMSGGPTRLRSRELHGATTWHCKQWLGYYKDLSPFGGRRVPRRRRNSSLRATTWRTRKTQYMYNWMKDIVAANTIQLWYRRPRYLATAAGQSPRDVHTRTDVKQIYGTTERIKRTQETEQVSTAVGRLETVAGHPGDAKHIGNIGTAYTEPARQ